MGVINVTPDSFSDDGLGDDVDAAVQRALTMQEDGADII
jgi:dihydropteroate synthase